MKPVCIIAGAGEYFAQPISPKPGDYVIAADGGFLHLRALNVRIDEVIGDFDSTGFLPDHPFVKRLPVEKDDTDMLFALREGLSRGYEEFHLFGGTGGRLDHTLANIQCLVWLARGGKRGYLYGDGYIVTALCGGRLSLGALDSGVVSVLAQDERAEGVCIRGLRYALEDGCLTNDFPIGVSNEFIGRPAEITVRKGVVLVYFPDSAPILE